MYVYGDLATDARVQRAGSALSGKNSVTVISNKPSRPILSTSFDSIFIDSPIKGFFGMLQSIRGAIRIVRKCDPDILYCHDYYSSLLAYFFIKSNAKFKIVYDAHELIIPEKGIIDRRLSFFRWFEKRIIKKVGLLICANEDRGKMMKDYYRLSDNPLVIPNVSKLEIEDNEEVNKVVEDHKVFFDNPLPAIVYAGVVTKGRCVDKLLDSVIRLMPKYKILIVGDGNAREELENKVGETPGLVSAFTGKVSYHTLGAILAKCDIGYVYYPNTTLNNRFCASNKVYEYSSILLPMVGNDNPTLKKELEGNGIGVVSDNVGEAIETIMSDIASFKNNCRLYNEKNRWEAYSDLLNSAIESL